LRAELVTNGETDFRRYFFSEVQTVKGVTLVGLLPPPLQSFVGYGAAVPGRQCLARSRSDVVQ
jgi:hypothetical protein